MSAPAHPPPDELLQWWLGESDAPQAEAVEMHLLSCDGCGELVDEMAALGSGLRAALDAGQLGLFIDARFLARLREAGRRTREYLVTPDSSVVCSVSPEDEVVVGRLQLPAPLAEGERLDAFLRSSLAGGGLRITDLPLDAGRREVVHMPRLDQLRAAPAHREEIELLAVDGAGAERPVGRYVFDHRPWGGGG